ncbi:hypothetical protein V6Z12_A07G213100 [Gossypium hirsutum]
MLTWTPSVLSCHTEKREREMAGSNEINLNECKGNWIWEHAKLKARMQTLQRNLRNVMKIIIFSPTRTKNENG